MDFLEKLKQLLGGGVQTPASPAINEARPWDDVSLRGAPIQPNPAANAAPPPAPTSSIEDAVAQAVALQKQREKVKTLVPDFINQ